MKNGTFNVIQVAELRNDSFAITVVYEGIVPAIGGMGVCDDPEVSVEILAVGPGDTDDEDHNCRILLVKIIGGDQKDLLGTAFRYSHEAQENS